MKIYKPLFTNSAAHFIMNATQMQGDSLKVFAFEFRDGLFLKRFMRLTFDLITLNSSGTFNFYIHHTSMPSLSRSEWIEENNSISSNFVRPDVSIQSIKQ